jgi:serine/threonine-protein kinase
VRHALHLKAREEPQLAQPEPVPLKPPSALPPGVSLGATAAAPAPPPLPAPLPATDDSDLLEPLPSPEKAAHRGARPGKKKRALTELDREWAQTRAAFKRLSRNSPCESEGMGMICERYDALDSDLQDADPSDASLLARVRQLHKSIERKSGQ